MPDHGAVSRLNAALEGRYHIERELGAGGMATVYVARDLKHNRNVALKVLKPELAAVVGAERFLAEIETTANLQHPHILPLFDSGEADGFLFYVMPYIEGETLRERIDRERQLPVDEALGIATAVAHALQTAHEAGVIHRDIKPGNILLSRGQPLVSDFGIALAVGKAGGGRLTETGLSVGTPFYMSPEQATGDQVIGPASDTYALACVLYEMLTGDPPYIGSTAQAVLGKIIQGIPVSATAVRKAVPRNVDAAIRKALERLPADRFTRAEDFARALADPAFRHGDPDATGITAAGSPVWRWWALAATTSTVLLAGALARDLTRPARPAAVMRFESPFRVGQEPRDFNTIPFALSPDGDYLVYRGPAVVSDVVQGPFGTLSLWVRRWDDPEATPIRGTEGADFPSVSPDGRSVVFAQGGEIRVASLDGGPIVTLAEGTYPKWGPDSWIYFHASEAELRRVPPNGGEAQLVRSLADGELNQVLFDVLPGGERALLMTTPDGNTWEMAALDLESGETTFLRPGVQPRYSPSGHLLFTAVGAPVETPLMAAPFNPSTLELGAAVAMVDSVVAFALSRSGLLVYSTGVAATPQEVEPVWVNRSGEAQLIDPRWRFSPGVGQQGSYGWRLSPDGARVAVTRVDGGNPDIWVKDLPDGPFDRVTFAEERDMSPSWLPNGDSLAFVREEQSLWLRPADGTGREVPVIEGQSVQQARWSPDRRWLVFRGTDIMGLSLDLDSVATPLVESPFIERGPALSPDGRWLAYSSTLSGREEVYVRPFPDVTGQERVSTEGGANPVWAHGSNELFFIDGDGNMVAARFSTEGRFRVIDRQVLFALRPELIGSPASGTGDGGDDLYDVSLDDQLFLMGRIVGGGGDSGGSAKVVLVQNFIEELRRRVGS